MLLRQSLNIRAKIIFDIIKPFLKGRIADVGAGNCLISDLISKESKLRVQPLDIIDNNLTNLNLKLFDGKNVPFKDDSFDASILIYVLQWVDDKENFLREVKRVTKSRMIILEDTPENIVEILLRGFGLLWKQRVSNS